MLRLGPAAGKRECVSEYRRLSLSTHPDKHIVLAEHPISDCSEEEIARKASALFEDLVRQLTSNVPTSAMRRRRLRSAEPTAICLLGA